MKPYLDELRVPFLPLSVGATDAGVKRVQEWLCFHGYTVGIDGDFGPATRAAVVAFQAAKFPNGGVLPGEVNLMTWGELIAPLGFAESRAPVALEFPAAVCWIAQRWLSAKAREIGGDNRGPFVRECGRGTDQSIVGFFPWCQAFASHVWLRAANDAVAQLPFPLSTAEGEESFYVPWVVNSARTMGKFRSRDSVFGKVPPGSMFFLPGLIEGRASHVHVGIVIADDGITIKTIEGNTNQDGSSNGYEVAMRFRRKASCDYGVL